MSEVAEKAARAAALWRDERLQEFWAETVQEQVSVFTNVSSTVEERESAHTILRALKTLETRMAAAVADHKLEKKGQHRGSD